MNVRQTILACVSQCLRRTAEFLFLWGVAVSAAIFLGQTDVEKQPNIGWIWVYILFTTIMFDLLVILLECQASSELTPENVV